jgi:glycerate kinase
MRILIAPDSFKGTASATDVAIALAAGWTSIRPQDTVIVLPLADGGEGSAAAIRATDPDAEEIPCAATGPDGRPVSAGWLLLTDGTAIVELAAASGLPQMEIPDPLGAQTRGFGELLAAATENPRVRRIVATVGGSAATDGGTGALSALGARFLDADGRPLPAGGGSLSRLATVDLAALTPPPGGGVEVLTDVTAPLLGRRGAAAVFGPQKGAGADDVEALDAALTRLAAVIGGHPDQSGAGAAGGTAFGLATLWSADLAAGARRIGEITGLPAALAGADLLITGEGRFDGQSTTGKVVGHLLESVARQRFLLVTGQLGAEPPDRIERTVELSVLAGSGAQAMQHTTHWLTRAGAELAGQIAD